MGLCRHESDVLRLRLKLSRGRREFHPKDLTCKARDNKLRDMTTTPEQTVTLAALVAAEIRAMMGRLDVRQAELARRLGENDQWLSIRLRGRAAIDINDRQADYWEFLKSAGSQFTWRNRVPGAIGEIFERHGFIWGAKWFHVDSMHFEYRPELIMLAKQGWPKK